MEADVKKTNHEVPVQDKPEDNSTSQEKEIGGYEDMKEPTEYGDWQSNGRCTDF